MSTWSDSICENTFETSHVRFIHENFSVLITIPLDQIQQNLLRRETCQTTAKPSDIVLQTWWRIPNPTLLMLPSEFFSKTFKFSMIFYSTWQSSGEGQWRKAYRSRKKESKQSETTWKQSEPVRSISNIEKRREFVLALWYEQCPKIFFKRLYTLNKGLLVLVENASFSKEGRVVMHNCIAGQGVKEQNSPSLQRSTQRHARISNGSRLYPSRHRGQVPLPAHHSITGMYGCIVLLLMISESAIAGIEIMRQTELAARTVRISCNRVNCASGWVITDSHRIRMSQYWLTPTL